MRLTNAQKILLQRYRSMNNYAVLNSSYGPRVCVCGNFVMDYNIYKLYVLYARQK